MPGKKSSAPSPSLAEWTAAALGALLLAGTVGFLVHDALTSHDTPPQPQLSVLGIEPQRGRYLVLMRVRNVGEATAAQLRVTARLTREGSTVEEAETEFDYVPGQSSREAGVFFARDPRAYALEFVQRSYQRP